MQIEHLAFNMRDAGTMIDWYVEYLDMPIQMRSEDPITVAFIGTVPGMLEIYCNPERPFFDPSSLDTLTFHLALISDNLIQDRDRLVEAGAQYVEGEADANGRGLLMLRCPWGIPLQLCHRVHPF